VSATTSILRTMRRLPAKPTAFVLLGLFVVLDAFALAPETDLFPSLGEPTRTLAQNIVNSLSLSIVALIVVVVSVKRPENRIGWLLQSSAVAAVTAEAFATYSRYAISVDPDSLVRGTLLGILSEVLWLSVFAQLIFLFMLFPSGSLLSPRWRIVAWGIVGGFLASAVSTSITAFADRHGDIQDSPVELALTVVDSAAALVVLGFWLAAVWPLVLRFRRGTDDERHQMKWFAYPTALFTAFVAFILVFDIVTGEEPTGARSGIVFAVLLALPPLGIGVAILKYRLYDIDIIISRTLVYGPLTATLAGTYSGATLFFRFLFVDWLGLNSDAAIASSTLLIAALFVPVKNRFQSLADKFFKEDEQKRMLSYGREFARYAELKQPTAVAQGYLRLVLDTVQSSSGRFVLVTSGTERVLAEIGSPEQPAETIPIRVGGSIVGRIEFSLDDGRLAPRPAHLLAIEESASMIAAGIASD